MTREPFIDIHCHLLPAIDDGAKDWNETLAMAKMAVAEGIETIICTPHQGGAFAHNRGEDIRGAVEEAQRFLEEQAVPLRLQAGADVRIESDIAAQLKSRNLLTLGDHGRHVLLELPHELYFPLKPVLDQLARIRMVGILSHPERNQGILRQPQVLRPLVDAGCLMQVTSGSLTGTFGDEIREFAEWMIQEGMAHFIATDAHGAKSRRPLLGRAWETVCEISGADVATRLCCRNPARVATGRDVTPGLVRTPTVAPVTGWFGRRKAV